MMNNADRLEQQLVALSLATHYPPTPDLVANFWQRLEAQPSRRSAPRLAFAGAVLAAILVAVPLTFALASPARDAAADLFHRINIFKTSESTAGLPTNITGTETTLERAKTALGLTDVRPTYPANLTLERVLMQRYGSAQTAALFYRGDSEAFVLLISDSAIGKGLPAGVAASAEPIGGVGDEAYWLTGARIVQSLTPGGFPIVGSERVVDENTLVWSRGRFVYRIEGNIERDEAIRVAQSVGVTP